MNYHTDKWIMERLEEHYKEALEHFPEERIVGIFYQGSGNYGLDTENSDSAAIYAQTSEKMGHCK